MVEIKSGNPVTSAYSRIQETLKTAECVYSFLKIEKKNTGIPRLMKKCIKIVL